MNNILKAFTINSFEDIIGHNQLLKPSGLLSKWNNHPFSFVLIGDPGIGKSSILKVCSQALKDYEIIYFNASNDPKQILTNVYNQINQQKICLIIDEIHALNSQNQTYLLKLIENENLLLLGSSTENPFVHLIPALRSRLHFFDLKKDEEQILDAIYEKFKNIKTNNHYQKEDFKNLLIYNEYDIRAFLKQISLIDENFKVDKIDNEFLIKSGLSPFKNSGEDTNLLHDLKSALHKSIRGSDPNAAIYYLAGLIRYGNIKEIIRRLYIITYEDIGLANPNLCLRVSVGLNACEKIGLPECRIILSNIVLELAMSRKSNSAYKAIDHALAYLDKNPVIKIPKHIKYFNNLDEYKYSKTTYMNPHNFINHYVDQKYLDENINEIFYQYDWSNEIEDKINKAYSDFIKANKRK